MVALSGERPSHAGECPAAWGDLRGEEVAAILGGSSAVKRNAVCGRPPGRMLFPDPLGDGCYVRHCRYSAPPYD